MAEVISFVAGFLVAWAIIIWLNSKHIRQARKKRKQEIEKNPEKKVQATKVIVFFYYDYISPGIHSRGLGGDF